MNQEKLLQIVFNPQKQILFVFLILGCSCCPKNKQKVDKNLAFDILVHPEKYDSSVKNNLRRLE